MPSPSPNQESASRSNILINGVPVSGNSINFDLQTGELSVSRKENQASPAEIGAPGDLRHSVRDELNAITQPLTAKDLQECIVREFQYAQQCLREETGSTLPEIQGMFSSVESSLESLCSDLPPVIDSYDQVSHVLPSLLETAAKHFDTSFAVIKTAFQRKKNLKLYVFGEAMTNIAALLGKRFPVWIDRDAVAKELQDFYRTHTVGLDYNTAFEIFCRRNPKENEKYDEATFVYRLYQRLLQEIQPLFVDRKIVEWYLARAKEEDRKYSEAYQSMSFTGSEKGLIFLQDNFQHRANVYEQALQHPTTADIEFRERIEVKPVSPPVQPESLSTGEAPPKVPIASPEAIAEGPSISRIAIIALCETAFQEIEKKVRSATRDIGAGSAMVKLMRETLFGSVLSSLPDVLHAGNKHLLQPFVKFCLQTRSRLKMYSLLGSELRITGSVSKPFSWEKNGDAIVALGAQTFSNVLGTVLEMLWEEMEIPTIPTKKFADTMSLDLADMDGLFTVDLRSEIGESRRVKDALKFKEFVTSINSFLDSLIFALPKTIDESTAEYMAKIILNARLMQIDGLQKVSRLNAPLARAKTLKLSDRNISAIHSLFAALENRSLSGEGGILDDTEAPPNVPVASPEAIAEGPSISREEIIELCKTAFRDLEREMQSSDYGRGVGIRVGIRDGKEVIASLSKTLFGSLLPALPESLHAGNKHLLQPFIEFCLQLRSLLHSNGMMENERKITGRVSKPGAWEQIRPVVGEMDPKGAMSLVRTVVTEFLSPVLPILWKKIGIPVIQKDELDDIVRRGMKEVTDAMCIMPFPSIVNAAQQKKFHRLVTEFDHLIVQVDLFFKSFLSSLPGALDRATAEYVAQCTINLQNLLIDTLAKIVPQGAKAARATLQKFSQENLGMLHSYFTDLEHPSSDIGIVNTDSPETSSVQTSRNTVLQSRSLQAAMHPLRNVVYTDTGHDSDSTNVAEPILFAGAEPPFDFYLDTALWDANKMLSHPVPENLDAALENNSLLTRKELQRMIDRIFTSFMSGDIELKPRLTNYEKELHLEPVMRKFRDVASGVIVKMTAEGSVRTMDAYRRLLGGLGSSVSATALIGRADELRELLAREINKELGKMEQALLKSKETAATPTPSIVQDAKSHSVPSPEPEEESVDHPLAENPLKDSLHILLEPEERTPETMERVLTEAVIACFDSCVRTFGFRCVTNDENALNARIARATVLLHAAIRSAMKGICAHGIPDFARIKNQVSRVRGLLNLPLSGLSAVEQELFLNIVMQGAIAEIDAMDDPFELINLVSDLDVKNLPVLTDDAAKESSGSEAVSVPSIVPTTAPETISEPLTREEITAQVQHSINAISPLFDQLVRKYSAKEVRIRKAQTAIEGIALGAVDDVLKLRQPEEVTKLCNKIAQLITGALRRQGQESGLKQDITAERMRIGEWIRGELEKRSGATLKNREAEPSTLVAEPAEDVQSLLRSLFGAKEKKEAEFLGHLISSAISNLCSVIVELLPKRSTPEAVSAASALHSFFLRMKDSIMQGMSRLTQLDRSSIVAVFENAVRNAEAATDLTLQGSDRSTVIDLLELDIAEWQGQATDFDLLHLIQKKSQSQSQSSLLDEASIRKVLIHREKGSIAEEHIAMALQLLKRLKADDIDVYLGRIKARPVRQKVLTQLEEAESCSGLNVHEREQVLQAALERIKVPAPVLTGEPGVPVSKKVSDSPEEQARKQTEYLRTLILQCRQSPAAVLENEAVLSIIHAKLGTWRFQHEMRMKWSKNDTKELIARSGMIQDPAMQPRVATPEVSSPEKKLPVPSPREQAATQSQRWDHGMIKDSMKDARMKENPVGWLITTISSRRGQALSGEDHYVFTTLVKEMFTSDTPMGLQEFCERSKELHSEWQLKFERKAEVNEASLSMEYRELESLFHRDKARDSLRWLVVSVFNNVYRTTAVNRESIVRSIEDTLRDDWSAGNIPSQPDYLARRKGVLSVNVEVPAVPVVESVVDVPEPVVPAAVVQDVVFVHERTVPVVPELVREVSVDVAEGDNKTADQNTALQQERDRLRALEEELAAKQKSLDDYNRFLAAQSAKLLKEKEALQAEREALSVDKQQLEDEKAFLDSERQELEEERDMVESEKLELDEVLEGREVAENNQRAISGVESYEEDEDDEGNDESANEDEAETEAFVELEVQQSVPLQEQKPEAAQKQEEEEPSATPSTSEQALKRCTYLRKQIMICMRGLDQNRASAGDILVTLKKILGGKKASISSEKLQDAIAKAPLSRDPAECIAHCKEYRRHYQERQGLLQQLKSTSAEWVEKVEKKAEKESFMQNSKFIEACVGDCSAEIDGNPCGDDEFIAELEKALSQVKDFE